jgi:hypothetical protein
MKCLSRIEMQEYADKEIPRDAETEIREHLASCEQCRTLLKEVNEDRDLINNIFNQIKIQDDETAVPEFKFPLKSRKKITLRMIIVAAAAIITGLIFLVKPGKQEITSEPIPESELLMYEFYEGKDLNKLWHEKSQIIILQDEKGNVIQSIITN